VETDGSGRGDVVARDNADVANGNERPRPHLTFETTRATRGCPDVQTLTAHVNDTRAVQIGGGGAESLLFRASSLMWLERFAGFATYLAGTPFPDNMSSVRPTQSQILPLQHAWRSVAGSRAVWIATSVVDETGNQTWCLAVAARGHSRWRRWTMSFFTEISTQRRGLK